MTKITKHQDPISGLIIFVGYLHGELYISRCDGQWAKASENTKRIWQL